MAVLLAAAIVRLPFLLAPFYFASDLTEFANWGWLAAEKGIAAAYELRTLDYPPLYIYVLAGIAHLATAWGAPSPTGGLSPELVTLLKTPAFVGDLALCGAAYGAARRWLPPTSAAATAATVALNPGLVYTTAIWGQVDSLHTLAMVLALLAALDARPLLAGATWVLAFFTKLHSLVALPVLALLVMREGSPAILRAGLGALLATAVALAPLLGSDLVSTAQVFLGAPEAWPTVTNNAFNFWYLVAIGTALVTGGVTPELSDQQLFLGTFTYRQLGFGLLRWP